MLERTLEPELTADYDEARAYDEMDHAAVNSDFVADLISSGVLDSGPVDPEADHSWLLDVGTGTARIPIELCQRARGCQIVALDAATCMLEIAKLNVAIGQCEHRIQLHHGDGKQLEFRTDLFDGVMCNSWLHHLPQPAIGLAEMWRVCKPGGWLFCRDLLRPDNLSLVEQLVASVAVNEPSGNQQLLRQSLQAALALDEVQTMVVTLGIPVQAVQITSDRHWTLCTRKPSAETTAPPCSNIST